MLPTTIVLPGIGGSGPEHWQSLWERAEPALTRFAPQSWDAPRLDDWKAALERAVAAAPQPPLLVAHSLACLLVAHWARPGAAVRGALLVAVPDAAGPAFPAEAAEFGDAPLHRLPFPALVVASSDDPYGTPDHARRMAAAWGAGLAEVGALGHINAASGIGVWPQGRMLLEAFAAGTRRA